MSTVTEKPSASGALRSLPAAIRSHEGYEIVLAAIAQRHTVTFDSVWGSLRALVAAQLSSDLAQPLLVVLPNEAQREDFQSDLRFFSTAAQSSFPAIEDFHGPRSLSEESVGERLRTLKSLVDHRSDLAKRHPKTNAQVVCSSIQACLQCVPDPRALNENRRILKVRERYDPEALRAWLVERKMQPVTAVELPGEFSWRGGILDIYPLDLGDPVRIEFFDDEIESIRFFDPSTQRSKQITESVEILVPEGLDIASATIADYLPTNTLVLWVEPSECEDEGRHYLTRSADQRGLTDVGTIRTSLSQFANGHVWSLSPTGYGATCRIASESVERFSGDLAHVRQELGSLDATTTAIVVGSTTAELERLRELLATLPVATEGRLQWEVGRLERGFGLRQNKMLVLTGSELFKRSELRRGSRRHLGKAIDSFLDLQEGDLVVHLSHGIGRYRGLKLIRKDEHAEEHLEIEFYGGTRVYVPGMKIGLVQKYVGGTKTRPQLAKLGGKSWVKQKKAAESAVMDMAAEMLELQAQRSSQPGIAFGADTVWQHEFDASFPYQETADQLHAIAAIKRDMERAKPMDRLLCGDVGFGKTEVAMRAAFKAVDNGYQVAIMAPTTILAEQHFRGFRARMAEFPFEIAKLSRFCSPEEERNNLAGLATGKVDIVIGTHRLASKDVQFENLGLVVIDEEQRFGVEVKERLKTLRAVVDVLTLSATPIPRTLHMSLVGLRDIANLETAPMDRVAVETQVTRWSDELIRNAILRELNRDGQIYFVHNRVNDIELIANRLRMLVPEARIGIGHGQLHEDELEMVMMDFIEHRFDLLVATTIVESGLDIPTANTMFIDEADRYGLADLHQLRGRVGRYKHRGYCYLMTDPYKHISPNAARRLRAIEEFSDLGAGFAISMRDLEIRGAGNLLGSKQSGHIAAVGYELYCELLETAVRSLKNEAPKLKADVEIHLPGEAFLPSEFVNDMRLKIDLYRRLARVGSFEQLSQLRDEMKDRFGELPEPADRLLKLSELRMEAFLWQIESIYVEERFLVFRYTNRARIQELAKRRQGKLRIVDDKTAYWPLEAKDLRPENILNRAKAVLRA